MARGIDDMEKVGKCVKVIGTMAASAFVAVVRVRKNNINELKDQNIILSLLSSKKDELHTIKGRSFKKKHDKKKIEELMREISDLESKIKR